MEHTNCEKRTRSNKGGTVKKLVTDDDEGGFWSKITAHVTETKPILKVLRRHDSSAPTVGKVYNGFYEIGESIKESQSDYKAEMEQMHADRWDYGGADFFRAAYAVDPEYVDNDLAENDEIMQGFLNTVEKIGILVEVRRAQGLDDRYVPAPHST